MARITLTDEQLAEIIRDTVAPEAGLEWEDPVFHSLGLMAVPILHRLVDAGDMVMFAESLLRNLEAPPDGLTAWDLDRNLWESRRKKGSRPFRMLAEMLVTMQHIRCLRNAGKTPDPDDYPGTFHVEGYQLAAKLLVQFSQ